MNPKAELVTETYNLCKSDEDFVMGDKVHLVVLNITSWRGLSTGALHYYGKMFLIKDSEINLENVSDWSVSAFGEPEELFKDLTLEEAQILDDKDNAYFDSRDLGTQVKRWKKGDSQTLRFDSIEQITKVGIEKYNKLNLNVSFISLIDNEKTSQSVIIEKN